LEPGQREEKGAATATKNNREGIMKASFRARIALDAIKDEKSLIGLAE
jgi:hypothetical protein